MVRAGRANRRLHGRGDRGRRARTIGEPLRCGRALAMSADSGRRLARRRDASPAARHVVDGRGRRRRARAARRLASSRLAPPASPMVGRERELRRRPATPSNRRSAIARASSSRCSALPASGSRGSSRSSSDDIATRRCVTRGAASPTARASRSGPCSRRSRRRSGSTTPTPPDDGQGEARRAARGRAGRRARRSACRGDDRARRGASAAAKRASPRCGALFEALARARRSSLVFDDIHWGEPTFLDLVEHLADWTRDAPILLICLARPDLLEVRPGWGGGKLNATSILLEPLSDAESAELVENLAGAELEESTHGRASSRRPRATRSSSRRCSRSRSTTGPDGRARRAANDPGTARGAPRPARPRRPRGHRAGGGPGQGLPRGRGCGARLGRAAPSVARPRSLVQQGADPAGPPAASAGRTYRFRHLLIRDAAYESIPKEARSELHERYGALARGAAGDRVTEYEEIVGYHLEQAYRYRAELGRSTTRPGRSPGRRLSGSARQAGAPSSRSDAPAGVNLISRAVAASAAGRSAARRSRPERPRRPGRRRDLSWAERVLTEAIEAAATTGDRRLVAQALVQRGFLRLLTGVDVAPRELLGVAERASAVFEELGDDRGLAQAWRLDGPGALPRPSPRALRRGAGARARPCT